MSASTLAVPKAYRGISILVGLLFLTSTAAFMIGSSLITSFFSGEIPKSSTLLAGVLLEIYCGLAVAGIGAAMLPVVRRYDQRRAAAYFAIRTLEFAVIGAVGVYIGSSTRLCLRRPREESAARPCQGPCRRRSYLVRRLR